MAPSASKTKKDFSITFRGVRGSYPTAGKEFLKYGGDTTCYEINAGGSLIIIDAGTGIISLGQDLIRKYTASGKSLEDRKPIEALMLFTHVHQDHVQGIPFFGPMHMPQSTFYIYGNDPTDMSFEESLSYSVKPPLFPITLNDLKAHKEIHSVFETHNIYMGNHLKEPIAVNKFRDLKTKKETVKKSEVEVECMKGYSHPTNGVMHYRINFNGKSIVVATDTEGYVGGDTRLIEFSKDADLLVHDSGYSNTSYNSLQGCKQGYGHSTPAMAVEVAQKSGVKQLAMVHHEPINTDSAVDAMEKSAKKDFANCFSAREMQVVTV